jgi:hypothetical protein
MATVEFLDFPRIPSNSLEFPRFSLESPRIPLEIPQVSPVVAREAGAGSGAKWLWHLGLRREEGGEEGESANFFAGEMGSIGSIGNLRVQGSGFGVQGSGQRSEAEKWVRLEIGLRGGGNGFDWKFDCEAGWARRLRNRKRLSWHTWLSSGSPPSVRPPSFRLHRMIGAGRGKSGIKIGVGSAGRAWGWASDKKDRSGVGLCALELSGAREAIQRADDSDRGTVHHVRVNKSCLQRRVTQKRLHLTDVVAGFEHVRLQNCGGRCDR